jgi:formylmethanofuran dehydrogenase subunit D
MTDLRKLHTNGSSTVVSLSNTAQNELGVESGDYVKVLVRDGEVILRSVEGL